MDEPLAPPAPSPAVPAPRPPGRPRTFACPNCGGAVTLRAVGQSISATCSQCSSLIDVADENLRIIQKAQAALEPSEIPIGSRGRLQDVEWEVVGYMRRSDRTGYYEWIEYLLFNPYRGYRFLVREQGHWTLVKMLTRDVPAAGSTIDLTVEGRRYAFFSKGQALTKYVAGEFYWRASTADVTETADYIASPHRLMVESNDEEIIVSEGVYLEPSLVAEAFKLPLADERDGPGVNQPNPHRRWLRVPLAALGVATLLQFGSLALSPGRQVASQTFTLTSADKGKTFASEPFRLDGRGNVEFETSAELKDDWLELDVALVNVETNRSYHASQGLENYSSGRVTERTSELLSPVPAGTYKLLIDTNAGLFTKVAATVPMVAREDYLQTWLRNNGQGGSFPSSQPTIAPAPANPLPSETFTVTVRHAVPIWSNYLGAVGLLALGAGFGFFRDRRFEQSRWEQGGIDEEAPSVSGNLAAGGFVAAAGSSSSDSGTDNWWSSSSDDDDDSGGSSSSDDSSSSSSSEDT